MEEFDAAHEWTLVKLNGNYYRVDPTYEEGYGGEGLLFFEMTNDRRAFFQNFRMFSEAFGRGPMWKASREEVWVCIRQGRWQNSCRERYM